MTEKQSLHWLHAVSEEVLPNETKEARDQLDVREKHRPVSEAAAKLAEMGDIMACKSTHSQAFQVE